MNDKISGLLRVAVAALFVASSSAAFAQNTGAVTANAFAIGLGTAKQGLASLLCGSAQLAVGQSAAAPICQTITGDVTISSGGVTAIGATKVTSAMLNSSVFSTAHSWSGQQTFVAPILGTIASGDGSALTGTAASFTAGHVTTNANLTGDVTSVGNATTLTNAPVIAKVLTGFTSGAGTVTAADSILSAIQKVYGNDALKAPLASPALTGTPTTPTATIGTNTTQIASTAFVAAAVTAGASGVASLNGQTGALAFITPPQGRLTLTTGVAVTTTDVTGATAHFYTPGMGGNQIPIYDGTNMVPTAFVELTQATTDTTKSPAAVTTNSIYDIFVWNDAGTIRATRGPAWSSDTSRGTGAGTSEIVLQNGIWLNKNAISNGPAASRGTLVGSVRSNASSQFVDSKAFRWVSNAYQTVPRPMSVLEATASWNYGSTSYRQANANAANQLDMLQTLSGNQLTADLYIGYSNTSASLQALIGISIDSVLTAPGSVFAGNISTAQYTPAANIITGQMAHYVGTPGLGRHTAIWEESSGAGGTYSFYGGSTAPSGITGSILN